MIPPVSILSLWMKKYPLAGRQADIFRQSQLEWDRHGCFIPIAGTLAIVTNGCPVELIAPEAYTDAAVLAALLAWRPTQRIYRFEPEFTKTLLKSSLKKIPVEALFHMPEWCCYFEFRDDKQFFPLSDGVKKTITGAWVHLEYDINLRCWEFRVAAATENNHVLPLALDLVDSDINTCLKQTIGRIRKNVPPAYKDMTEETVKTYNRELLEVCLNYCLYLCSEKPDILGPDSRSRPKPKKTKKGLRLFPPKKPSEYACGYRIGSALKAAAYQAETGAKGPADKRRSPVGHIRRAHWHTFRYGPRRRKAKVRWMPPIPVNLDIDEMPLPTVITVKGKG